MKQSIFLFIILNISSCVKTEESYQIDPRGFGDSSITLSDIADDIVYIPLDNKFPIGLVYKLKITNEYIYLSAKDLGILQFDRSGNFIRKFGKHGRGPGEYNYGMNFAVDEQSGSIYVIKIK